MSLKRLVVLAAAFSACASPVARPGAGEDAGLVEDAGDLDAGTAPDAGVSEDAGLDAGVTEDAGPADAGVDAGTVLDAGVADAGQVHVIQNVFIILMENKNWDQINVAANAPYITGSLLPHGAHANKYSNPAGIHPSLPNYLWLEAGTNFGVTNDGDPSANHQSSTAHLVTQLEQAGISWKSYQEGIDGTTCPLSGGNGYAPKHNPMIYFDDVTDTRDVNSQHCKDHVRPYSELATDLQNGTVARYNFITPTLCHDGHDNCTDSNPLNDIANQVKQSDTWLQGALPPIFASQTYQNGGAVFVVWDESTASLSCLSLSPQCPTGMMVFSPWAKSDYANDVPYDHSSMVRTIQEIFGVGPFLGGAANATDLSDMFEVFP